jgi:hypothetical protein
MSNIAYKKIFLFFISNLHGEDILEEIAGGALLAIQV